MYSGELKSESLSWPCGEPQGGTPSGSTSIGIDLARYCSSLIILLTAGSCALPQSEQSLQAHSPPSETSTVIYEATNSAQKAADIEKASIENLTINKHLNFDACLKHALRHNLKAQIAVLGVQSAAQGERIARAAFDPAIGFTMVGYPNDGVGFENTKESLVLRKKLITGTEINARGGTAFLGNYDNTPGYTSTGREGSIGIRQPLLRGAGIGVNRAGIDIARITTRSADAGARAEVMEVLRATESAYWTAAWARESKRVQMESLARSERILRDVNVRKNVGTATKINQLEAEAAVSAAEELVERADQQAKDAISNLCYLLGLPSGEVPDGIILDVFAVPVSGKVNPKASYDNALRENPLEVLLANEVERRTIESRVARNAMLPAVDLEVNAGTSGLFAYSQGTSPTTSNTTANTAKSSSSTNWNAILRMSIPWTFRAERAQAERTKVELLRSRTAMEDGQRQLLHDIYEVCREIESDHRQWDAAKKGYAVNRAKWEEQLMRYQEGLSSVRDLREAEGELHNANLRNLSAQLAIVLAQSRLARLDGTILPRHGLTF